MRTTHNCFKNQIHGHILNSVLSEDHGSTPKEQLSAVVEGFHNWYGPYEQKRIPNRQDAFIDWSWGLPSEWNVEYTNYNINETVKNWFSACGENYKEPKDSSKTNDLYMGLLYREFNTLLKQNDLNLF